MAVAAGQPIDVDDVVKRIATTTLTTDSAGFTTTETSIGSVTASLVDGVTYSITAHGAIDSSASGDSCDVRIREDSVSGTEMTLRRIHLIDDTGRWGFTVYAEYTATATGSKTFHVTGDRPGGAGGTLVRKASATIPTYIFVDRVSE